jgi:hypothetical protein
MRKLIVAGLALTALLGVALWNLRQPEPPSLASPVPWPYGDDLFIEPECAAAARNRPPDLVWTAPDVPLDEFVPTPIRDIRVRMVGNKVRLAGVLHVEYEFSGVFPTWADVDRQRYGAVRVAVRSLWRQEPYLATKAPRIRGRCAVIDGVVGRIPPLADVVWAGTASVFPVMRLAVWSEPFHEITLDVTLVPPPPPLGKRR